MIIITDLSSLISMIIQGKNCQDPDAPIDLYDDLSPAKTDAKEEIVNIVFKILDSDDTTMTDGEDDDLDIEFIRKHVEDELRSIIKDTEHRLITDVTIHGDNIIKLHEEK